jgi:two-component system chemotaxis response regulator CheV
MSKSEILLETGTNEFEFIEFYIDDDSLDAPRRDYFGVNVAKVLEVVEAPSGLEVSEGAPHPSYLGTIPLRDLILPVIDLSVWLDIKKEIKETDLIVVTEFNGEVTGFLVSGVTQIHRVFWGDLEAPSKYISEVETNCITGTLSMGERFVLMIDLESILAELNPGMMKLDEENIYHGDEVYKAVIADDSTSVRALLLKNFENANFEVNAFSDGEQAWQGLLEIKRKVAEEGRDITEVLDIVIADIEMPRMDGYTLTKQIKEDKELSKLPVILFSSLITKGLFHKGEQVKADDQVTKPEFSALTERAIALIEKYRQKSLDV